MRRADAISRYAEEMLFLPANLRAQLVELARKAAHGDLTFEAAGREMLQLHSDYGPAFFLLGQARAEASDPDEAEALYWRALELDPCRYAGYLALSELASRRDSDSGVAAGLFPLGLYKLSLLEKIDSKVSDTFSQGRQSGLDLSDPETYRLLAAASEVEFRKVETKEARARLLPYWLLNDLQIQAESAVEAGLLDRIRENAALCIPAWRGVLRSWAQWHSEIGAAALQMILAILGEIGGPEMLEDLLELVTDPDEGIFLHANWAVWRIAQRFPAEGLSSFRAAMTHASISLRCAISDHLSLMPEVDGLPSALIEVLDAFRELKNDPDAPYVLANVVDALEQLGKGDEATRVFERYHVMLPNKGIKKLARLLEHPDGFLPKLAQLEIDGVTIEDICVKRIFLLEEEDSEEEDTGEPPAVKPGRNDLCWCGSGKKYKKCHLAADEEAQRSGTGREDNRPAGNPLFSELYRDVMESSKVWHTREDFERATRLYFDSGPEETDPDHPQMPGFFEWYLFDYRSPGTGRTMVEEYLQRRNAALPERKRAMLESWRAARVRLCEVERVEPEKGVELKDRFAGDRFFIQDVSSSRSLVRFDATLTRVMQFEGRWEFAGNGLIIPRMMLPSFAERIERESSEAGQSPADYLGAHSHRWHRLVAEMRHEHLRGLRVVNAEGDDLEFSSATYAVTDEAAVLPALRAAKVFEDTTSDGDESGVHTFGWLEAGAAESRRSYGHIEIREGELRLECNSRKRLGIGRQLLEKHAGTWLRHTGDSFQSLDAVKAATGPGSQRREKPPGIPPEVEREIILKYQAQHYANWPDEPLPALGGQTPREAVRSEAGRRAVEQLLRDFENGEEREKRAGRAAFDFGPIRKELGL